MSIGRQRLVESASVSILVTSEYAITLADFSIALGFGVFVVFTSVNFVQSPGRQYSQSRRTYGLGVYFSPEN